MIQDSRGFRYKLRVIRPICCLLLAVLTFAILGCGGKEAKLPTLVQIQPTNVTLAPGGVEYFSALLDGDSFPELIWSVDGPGEITQDGRFTASSSAGNATVIVSVKDNPSLNARANVTVTSGVQVRITAPTLPLPKVTVRSTIDFDSTITGAANPAVTWSATAGEVSSTGHYKAPDSPGTYTVTVTSVEDPTKSAVQDVTVSDTANVRISVEGKGDVVLELAIAEAPNTTANMVSLVNKKYYDGIIFHRYEPGFVIQGGDPLTKTLPLDDPSIGTGGPGYTIDFETNSLLHTKYALGMARSSERNSGGSQFYICLEAQPSLDGNYVVFGKVLSGQDIVDQLRRGDKITKMVVE